MTENPLTTNQKCCRIKNRNYAASLLSANKPSMNAKKPKCLKVRERLFTKKRNIMKRILK